MTISVNLAAFFHLVLMCEQDSSNTKKKSAAETGQKLKRKNFVCEQQM